MLAAQSNNSRLTEKNVLTISLLLVFILLVSWNWSQPAVAQTSLPELSALPLTFPVQSPEIAAYFNRVADPDDIAAFPEPFVHLLPQVTTGRKMVFYRSWAEAERELDGLIDQIDLIGYNPEHWEHTPLAEQQNLPEVVQRAATFAHEHGRQFMLVPDRRFAEEHLRQVVPYIDAVVLQGQRLQKDPDAFATWSRDMISLVRAGNPVVEIYVQVGATQGASSEMLDAIRMVAADIDGIAVWSLPRSLTTLQEFVSPLREPLPQSEPMPTVLTTTAVDEIQVTVENTDPATVRQVGVTTRLKDLALVGSGLIIGLIVGFSLGRMRWKQDLQPLHGKNVTKQQSH